MRKDFHDIKLADLTSFYSEIKFEWKSENGSIIKCRQKLLVTRKTHNNFFFLLKHFNEYAKWSSQEKV